MANKRANERTDDIDEIAGALAGNTKPVVQSGPTADDLVYWLEQLEEGLYKRVIKSSKLRRKGNQALRRSGNGE